ncbi:tetratricopeptide repeat protein [Novosphingobium jiangmenense]|uniref:Tetratricopeptide repeat protein n=1 Tax=Novosphingobium jiangmenense TaxID=2791981 RepID=A0ABS0HEU4_9SPHN|nr:tetratricopeptide repeat protein [Novosphingobium jiangmenense]MBF9150545.1 tetratricopeptide repeat protein [Novosphingobium jiangmenense]
MALRPDRPQSRSNQLAERSAGGDAFLREVDDALREDQVYTAIQKYGKPVGAVILAGLLGLGGYLWYENHSNSKAAEQGEALTKALDDIEVRNLKAATEAVAPLAKDGTDGYRATAKMLAAGVLSEQGKNAEAAKAFAEIAADTGIPQAYRDLATIREVSLTFDQLGPDKVVERLKPLAVPGNAWFGSAGELVGMAYVKQGKNDLAGALFAQIAKDKTVPDTLRRRTRQMAGLLGVDAVEDPGTATIVQRAQ